MTETEARKFIDELKVLCRTYERLAKCRIDYTLEEIHKGGKLKWLTANNITLKIEKEKIVH